MCVVCRVASLRCCRTAAAGVVWWSHGGAPVPVVWVALYPPVHTPAASATNSILRKHEFYQVRTLHHGEWCRVGTMGQGSTLYRALVTGAPMGTVYRGALHRGTV